MRTKKSLFFLFPFLLISLITLGPMSCHWVPSSSPPVLIIAVDQLGVNQINCNTDSSSELHSGMALLCQESIRFTHAFTTSPLSGPAMASLLTAQYPFQHGLRSNNQSFLPSRVTTLPETAQQKNYATSFFSGGAPVLRKLNLQQGFELFDDTFIPTANHLFRPFSKLQKDFSTWLSDIGHQNFFSVFYVPDLAFVNRPTQTPLGENRPLSYDSQLEEFDESLYIFIKSLKQKKIWDSTMIILVGLSGPDPQSRGDELPNLNLFSEKTQVGLLIKPAQKPRDLGMNWSFDANVTLADVGATLGQLWGLASTDSNFPVISLTEVLRTPSPKLLTDRPILTESGWGDKSSFRYAVRWSQYLYLMDEAPKVYNSLIDRQELSPIRIGESGLQEQWNEVRQRIGFLQNKPWSPPSKEEFLKWQGLSEIFLSEEPTRPSVAFERLAHRLKNLPEVTDLYSRELINQQSWNDLEKWAQGLNQTDLEKVALKNLKKENKRPFTHPCLALLEISQPQNKDIKNCEDLTALSLLDWYWTERSDSADALTKENARKKFLRLYTLHRLDQKIAENNYALHGVWDLSATNASRALTLDLMLAVPELQKLRQIAIKHVQQLKED